MRLTQEIRRQQWHPLGASRIPMAPIAALWPPEWLNGDNEVFYLALGDPQLQPVSAQRSGVAVVAVPSENHTIILGAVMSVVDDAGARVQNAPATVMVTDGTARAWMNRPVPIGAFFGELGSQQGWWPYRKFIRAGSELTVTIVSRALVDLTFRPFLIGMRVYP